MFVLELKSGPNKGQAIGLRRGQILVIGRSTEADAQLDDPNVSGRHAALTWDDDGFAIQDLGSRNGTYLNGHRIEAKTALKVADHLQIGFQILELREAEAAFAISEPTEVNQTPQEVTQKVLALQTNATLVMPLGALLADRADTVVPGRSPEAMTPKLLALGTQKTQMAEGPAREAASHDSILAAADLAKRVQLERNARAIIHVAGRFDSFNVLPVTIGREHGSGLVLDDERVSLRHAVIDHRDDQFLLRDVGSSNGTFVNGQRVVMHKLANGDVIGIGHYTMLVVLGPSCLGLEVSAPSLVEEATQVGSHRPIGLIDAPLASGGRRKKKASEIVWAASSDLDRGVFRTRSAFVALVIGVSATLWMLANGGSEILAGGQLMAAHESTQFEAAAGLAGRGGCTGCHIGVGKISAVRCLDCHLDSRPNPEHAMADLRCHDCHSEHAGAGFRSSATAALDCMRCHAEPHARLIREEPKLVSSFRPDEPADEQFHVAHHIERAIPCTTCHGDVSDAQVFTEARHRCGQCHAPDHVRAEDCHQCHRMHPDRDGPVPLDAVPARTAPRFASRGVAWALGMLALPFVFAGLIPRRRRVEIHGSSDSEG